MIFIDGNSLSLQQIKTISCQREQVALSPDSKEKVIKCRKYVDDVIAQGRVVYGLTTGFGKFATINIPAKDTKELQRNLIISHATAVGKALSTCETRAIMLLRANVLAKGHSGICLQTLESLIEMLNKGVHPIIPEKGSVGASGDLAQLSHLALVLIGLGKAEYEGQIISGRQAMETCGIPIVELEAKEGLALNNGTQVMTAITALVYLKAAALIKQADLIAAMSIDSLLGTPAAFNPLIHALRPYEGQKNSAHNLFTLLSASQIRKNHLDCENVQDAYSLRCTPQVHGASRTALKYVKDVLEIEINAATDNPLIFPDADEVISGGNFHGQPVAIAADTLGIALAEIANISERRLEQMLNPAINRGLNAFLAPRPGLDSGFMIAQLTAASLVSENKGKAHPASVDSIPTSANQEDHVSMGTIAANKAREILDNVAYVLSIELMAACQAIESRKYKTAPALEAIKDHVRKHVKRLEKDREINADMLAMKQIIDGDEILDVAGKFLVLK